MSADILEAEVTEVTEEQQRPQHLFKPGVSGNPRGRPKGSRNKLGEDFISALQHDFRSHGEEVIARVREDKPDQYLKVIASILPRELTVNHNATSELDDDELAALITTVRSNLTLVAESLGSRASDKTEPQQDQPALPLDGTTET